MSSKNVVILIGRLRQNVKLSYLPTGTPKCDFTLATSEKYEKNGERHETTEWHRIIVFGKQAENCSKYIGKGSLVCVDGKIQYRNFENKDGNKVYLTEICASNVTFLDTRKEASPQTFEQMESVLDQKLTAGTDDAFTSDDIPF